MSLRLKVASLFCGCGGSDLGMIGGFRYLGKEYERLMFDIVYAMDFDDKAVETYNANFEHKAVQADVTKVDFNDIKEDIDILIGGFPCQSFSTVNPTKDTNDARANLYKEIVRFLRTKKPKYFICENVKGLLTLQKGSIIQKIVREFGAEGYNVQYQLLKAVEYGVPQRRERVIIVGIRKDLEVAYRYPFRTNTESDSVPLKAVIDELAIENKKYYFSERAVQGMKNAKNNMKRGLWQDLNKPCLTVTSHLAKTSINSRDPILLVDPQTELYRRFTPREAARIQSFPESFEFPVSETKAYKQIGNAVPPVLMWHVAKALQDSIKRPKHSKEEIFATDSAVEDYVFEQLTFDDLLVVAQKPLTLHGTYRTNARKWILEKGLYNYPVTEEALDKYQELLAVRRLILTRQKDDPLYFAVKGYSIVSQNEVKALDYPVKPKHSESTQYILYKLEKLNEAIPLFNADDAYIIGKGVVR